MFFAHRKAARILLTLDENDPRRLFEGKFGGFGGKEGLIDVAFRAIVCLLLLVFRNVPILNMIITSVRLIKCSSCNR